MTDAAAGTGNRFFGPLQVLDSWLTPLLENNLGGLGNLVLDVLELVGGLLGGL